MPELPFLPNPPLPYTGTLSMHPDRGWRAMKNQHNWKPFKGDKLFNWFIARPDTDGMTKKEIEENGTKNVHYFHTVDAAVYWSNSYQLRVKKTYIDLTKAMTTVKEMLDDNPCGIMDDSNLVSGRKRDRKQTEFFEFKDESSDDDKRTRSF